MKKVLLAAMIVIIVLSGCNNGTSDIERPDINLNTEQPGTNEPLETEHSVSEIIDSVYLLSIYQSGSHSDKKYYNLMGWQEYIKEKFAIDINVFYNTKGMTSQAVYYYNYFPAYPHATVTGVFNDTNPEDVYDLTPFYEIYGWSDFIDRNYMQELTVEGKLYAVPSAPNRYIIPRYYNKEYLDTLAMEVPTDINSFHKYLIDSKNLIKGEGLRLPMFISNHRVFPSTADIFRSFGSYVNSEYNSTISYNPNTQTFEDAVFSENFIDAIGFLKNLQEQDLMGIWGEGHCPEDMYQNPFIGDRFKVNKAFATEYNVVYDKKSNIFQKYTSAELGYEAVSGYYLMNTNIKNICEIRSDMGFYVFPNSIDNIQGTVELFNAIMTDKSYYADLLYGVENTDYIYLNDELLPSPPSFGTFPAIRLIIPVEDPNNYYSAGNIDVVKGLTSDLLYESNIFNQVTRYGRTINVTVGGTMHDNLFATCVSPSDAIEEYKKWFFRGGMHEAIKTLNEKINAVPSYDYTP